MDTSAAGDADEVLDERLDSLIGELERVSSDNELLNETVGRLNGAVKVLAAALVAVFVLFLAVGLLGAGFISSNHDRLNDQEASDAQREKDQKNERSRVTAALVGNCAVGNVIQGVVHDDLASMKVDQPFPTTPAFEAWLDKRLEAHAPIDCKVIVPPDLGTAQLCLQYPDRLDPDTGKPIPTTTTPENGRACAG